MEPYEIPGGGENPQPSLETVKYIELVPGGKPGVGYVAELKEGVSHENPHRIRNGNYQCIRRG